MFVQHPTSGLRGIDTSKPGWVDALLAFHRTNFGDATMTAGEGEPPPPGQTDPPAGDGKGGDAAKGFPDNTPWREMTTEQQVAYWQHQSKRHEGRAKAFDGLTPEQLTDLREKARRHDDLERELMSDRERAALEAGEAAKAETTSTYLPRLVAAEFKAAAAGRIAADALKGIIEPLDLSRFVKDGEVDEAKVAAYVDSIAPATKQQRGPSATGLGGRRDAGGAAGDQGRAMAAKRFGTATA